jgi:hypothetical protein
VGLRAGLKVSEKTGEVVHIYRNNEARRCNNCCSGKAISIIQPVRARACVCVFVAFGIEHNIVICGLPLSTMFSHIIS